MASFYSIIAAIIWFNIAMLVVVAFSRSTIFLVKYSTSVLLICALLGLIRVLIPLDLSFSYVIRSYRFFPTLRESLKSDVIPGDGYLSLGYMLLCIWATGTLIVMIRTSRQLIHEKQQHHRYKLVESEQIDRVFAGLDLRRAKVLISPDIQVPMVTGIFIAQIYMPNLKLTDEEIGLIISHEYQHFISCDTLIKVFYLALEAAFWWNPAVHKFRKHLDRLLELRCDANITKRMDDNGKDAYLSSILSVIKQLQGNNEVVQVSAIPFVTLNSDDLIKQRFEVVLNRNHSRKVQIVAIIILFAVFLLSYTIIIQPAGFPSSDELESAGAVSITPENAIIHILDDGSMKLYVGGEFLWDVDDEMIKDDLHSSLPTYYEGG